MPRELSNITEKDLAWLALKDELRQVIKTKKDWERFIEYMSVYFKN